MATLLNCSNMSFSLIVIHLLIVLRVHSTQIRGVPASSEYALLFPFASYCCECNFVLFKSKMPALVLGVLKILVMEYLNNLDVKEKHSSSSLRTNSKRFEIPIEVAT